MLHVMVAAEFRNGGYGFGRILQLILGQPYAGLDAVFHTGNAESVFINHLKIAFTQMKLLRHSGYMPEQLGTVVNSLAQVHRIMIMR